MPVSLGILGVESTHAEIFSAFFNSGSMNGFSADRACPIDTPARLDTVLRLGGIQSAVADPIALIEGSDAVLLTTRLAATHPEWIRACLMRRRPVFGDKPFAPTPGEAAALLALAHENDTILLGGSTLAFLPAVAELASRAAQCKTALIRYRADPDSPFGGYDFYCSHLTDLAATLFRGATAVYARRDGGTVSTIVSYPGRHVLLQSTPLFGEPNIVLDFGGTLETTVLDEKACYAAGLTAFARAVTEHRQPDMTRLVESAALLAAIRQSLQSGQPQTVEQIKTI